MQMNKQQFQLIAGYSGLIYAIGNALDDKISIMFNSAILETDFFIEASEHFDIVKQYSNEDECNVVIDNKR